MTSYDVNAGQPTKKWPQYVAALAATGGALAAGASLGWTSPANPKLVNGTEMEYDFPVTEDQASWIGSSLNLGAAAVCIPIGLLINLIGRKWAMLGLVIPFTIGWALLVWAQNLAMMIVARVFIGIAGGAFCVAAPLYIGEIAQKEIRGQLGSFFQLNVTIGILFVYAVGAGVSVFWLSIICGIIPLVFGLIFFFMPESPTYLVRREKNQEASKAFKWLRGDQYDPAEDIAELQNENEEQKANNLSIAEALGRKTSVRGLVISFGLMFFQQMSGINAVIFYTTDIFAAAGTDINPEIATIIVGVMQVVATFVSTLVVDRLGRRILLLMSDAVMALCTLFLGIYFFMKQNDENSVGNLGWLPIVALCVFIVMFSLGFGPVPWLMMGELFASDVKGIAAPLSGTLNWLLAFVITKTFVNLKALLGDGQTFWLFSGLSILGTVFVFFIVPETKGKSLNEIQKMLAGEKSTAEVEEDKN
ncbi:CLUMA_CG017640, isoform A [Clunio marinus]|uniref:Facilitated trehalose transporter Tret1 n=1 Tax=Clunio marinus TaxID=568069 RepID=A0A1J1IWB4_9DIPT|nr:CLUMA_CG017640, isoform A [Clunio marinus]